MNVDNISTMTPQKAGRFVPIVEILHGVVQNEGLLGAFCDIMDVAVVIGRLDVEDTVAAYG